MPDIFDAIHEQMGGQAQGAPQAPQGGDLFDQIHAQVSHQGQQVLPAANYSPSAYFAQHPNMNPLAVSQAFNQLAGRGNIPQPVSPQEIAQARVGDVGTMGQLGRGMGEAIGHGTVGAVGLVNPQAGAQLREQNALAYAHQGAAGQAGEFVGNLTQAPMMMNPIGRVLGAAEAAGNARIDVNQARAQGAQISGAGELGDAAASAALNWLVSKVGAKGLTGPAAGTVVKSLLPQLENQFGQAAARVAATSLLEGGLNVAQQYNQNAVNALAGTGSNDLTQGGGAALGQGMALGGIGRAVHEALAPAHVQPESPKPVAGENQSQQPQPESNQPPALLQRKVHEANEPFDLDQVSTQPKVPHEQNQAVANRPVAPAEHAPSLPETRPPAVQEHAAANAAGPEPVRPGTEKPAAAGGEREFPADHILGEIQKHNTGQLDEEATRQLVGDQPYVRRDVPIDQIGKVRGAAGIDRERAVKYSKMDAAGQPPIVIDSEGRPIDGKHRFVAARLRGDETIPAYVPKEWAGKNMPPAVEQTAPPSKQVQTEGTQPAPATIEQKPSFFEQMKAKGAAAIEQGKRLAAEESGAAHLDYTRAFAEKSVKPAIADVGNGLKDLATGLRRSFGGQEGTGVERTKGLLKKMGAERAQRMDQFHDQMHQAEKLIDSLPVDEQNRITDAAETGQKQIDPKMQPIADALRQQYDDRLSQIQSRDPEFAGISDYMAHAWKQSDKANQVIEEFLQRRPLGGNKAFSKQRVFLTQQEGIDAGLEPVSNNPVTMAKLKLHQMDKWITAFDVRKDLENKGLLKAEPTNGKIPDGFSRVNDPMFRGKIMPDEMASVLNNTLAPGIMSHPEFGATLRGVRTAANLMNQASLSLSGIHAVTSSINSAVSEFGLGIRELAEGKPLSGAKKMAMGFTGVGPAARDLWQGSKLLREWVKPGSSGDPQLSVIADALKEQGGRAKMDAFYHTGMAEKMMKSFREGNPIAGVLRAPFAAMDLAAKPIMEFMVPRLKLGAFMQIAKARLADNPGMAAGELSKSMGDAWRSLDNRFGEMVQDNRFWNQTARHLASLTFRSVGWNYGTLDEMGGGIKDFAANAKKLATGDIKNAEFTHRMAYTVALPALVGTWGAMLNYALNGHAPKTLQDCFYIPTGQKDEQGRDEKIALPSYMKDVLSSAHSPVRTVAGKLHPLVGTTMDMLANRDFYGNKIYEGNGLETVKDLAKYAGKQSLPISLKGYVEGQQQGQKHPLLQLAGISQAPKFASESKAEQAAYGLMQQDQGKARTHQQADRHDTMMALEQELRTHDPHAADHIQQAVQEQKLTAKDAQLLNKKAKEPGGLQSILQHGNLDPHDIMEKVWPKMSAEEKQKYRLTVRGKIGRANLPQSEKMQLWEKTNE